MNDQTGFDIGFMSRRWLRHHGYPNQQRGDVGEWYDQLGLTKGRNQVADSLLFGLSGISADTGLPVLPYVAVHSGGRIHFVTAALERLAEDPELGRDGAFALLRREQRQFASVLAVPTADCYLLADIETGLIIVYADRFYRLENDNVWTVPSLDAVLRSRGWTFVGTCTPLADD